MVCKYYGDCEHQSEWCKSDSMLVKCNYGLNRLYDEQIIKIADLEDENKKLKQQLEAEKNKHIKIQYKCHEYTISEFCNRMDKLERLMKLSAEELMPDICDYCVNDGSKRCVEESAEEGCGNMACQFAYWRYYDEVKELLKDEK